MSFPVIAEWYFMVWIVDLKEIDCQIISPTKMGLFGISRELHFGVCNLGEPRASPQARDEYLLKEEEVGKATVNGESTAFHWLSS